MDTDKWFRVTFVLPSGFQYAVTGRATSKVEAVRLADETVEYVSHIGISDHLNADGITVRSPARLKVEPIQAEGATSGFGVVITAPDGTVTRK